MVILQKCFIIAEEHEDSSSDDGTTNSELPDDGTNNSELPGDSTTNSQLPDDGTTNSQLPDDEHIEFRGTDEQLTSTDNVSVSCHNTVVLGLW